MLLKKIFITKLSRNILNFNLTTYFRKVQIGVGHSNSVLYE